MTMILTHGGRPRRRHGFCKCTQPYAHIRTVLLTRITSDNVEHTNDKLLQFAVNKDGQLLEEAENYDANDSLLSAFVHFWAGISVEFKDGRKGLVRQG